MDVVTYAAAVGAAKKYTDEQIGSDDAVKYTEQDLTTAQQAQARTNIGAASVDSVPTSLAELSDDSTHRLVTDVEKTTWNSTIPSTAKGASNGVAELDSNGKVPSSQLPSFVDDVIEGYYSTLDDRFYEESTFTTLIEPVAGKSWVDIPANKSYRWTGSVYVRVDEGVQIGETADTAYAGNKGKANADAIAAIKDGVSIDSFSDVETALAGKVDAVQGKGLSTNDYTSEEKTKLAGLENYDDTGIQGDISAIEEVIPSTATSQNQLATAADIPTDAVKYSAQTLTDAQKTQARTNIGAGTSSFSGNYSDLTNPPPLVKGTGTGGNTIGGTGGTAMNSAKNLNSYAYGYLAGAYANYAFAFGDRAFAGNSNRNTGKHAVAIGNNVSAEKDYEIALGTFNQSNADTLFSIGDGTSDSDRHNLIELKTDGRMFLNGNAVKTEGGDDNKLRLGQICALKVVSSSDCRVQPKNGFYNLFGSISSIIFSSAEGGSIATSVLIYQFGDFIGFFHPSLSNAVQVQLIDGRRIGHTVTGQWIKVENCYMMFYGCNNLTSLDLSMFDTSEVKNMTSMFSGCTNLATLDISSFDMSNVVGYSYMFGSSSSNRPPLTTLKAPRINPYNSIPLNKTLYSQDGTAYTKLPVTTGTSIELRQSWT